MSRGRPGGAPVLDPGLQAERTMISWQRTALELGAIGALMLHSAAKHPANWYLGGLGLAVSLGLLVISERRHVTTVRRIAAGHTPAAPRMIRLLAAAAIGLMVAALLSVAPYL